MAQNLPLASHAGEDIKHVLTIVGVEFANATGMVFAISLEPSMAPLLSATVTLLDTTEDEDGVPISIIQARVAQASVESMIAGLSVDPWDDVPLFYEFRVPSLPGDLGTASESTLLFGEYIVKGSVDV